MTRSAVVRLHLAVLAVLVIAGCASSAPEVVESFDAGTGVTITRTATPMIFYHDNSAAAAHARDFVYVGPIAVNQMGRYRYYLWLGIWSVIDTEDPSTRRDGFESVVLFADGEPMLLDVQGWTPDAIGVSESLYAKPVSSAAEAYYAVTDDQIRILAAARNITMRAGVTNGREYLQWEGQKSARGALSLFAASL